MFRVRFWGVRGSLPVSGPEFQRYGGNTFCVEIQCGEHRLLFDAGSGISPASRALLAEGITNYNLFFSHCHYDHIIGLPYFIPIYSPDTDVTIWSGHMTNGMTTRQMVSEFIQPPWFPIKLDACRANMKFMDFKMGDKLDAFPGIGMRTGKLDHPGNAVGYRIEWKGRSVAIITDTEHEPGGDLDPNVMSLIEDVDVFLYDSMYTDDEMARHRGFGHSSWQHALRLAKASRAKKVGFVHHSPYRTDAELDMIDRKAREIFPGAFAVREGDVLDVT